MSDVDNLKGHIYLGLWLYEVQSMIIWVHVLGQNITAGAYGGENCSWWKNREKTIRYSKGLLSVIHFFQVGFLLKLSEPPNIKSQPTGGAPRVWPFGSVSKSKHLHGAKFLPSIRSAKLTFEETECVLSLWVPVPWDSIDSILTLERSPSVTTL